MLNIFIDTNVYIGLLTNKDDRKLFDELKGYNWLEERQESYINISN